MNRKSGILLVFLLSLMTITSIQINAFSDDFQIDVRAKAVDADGDSVKNDIAISGSIIIAGMEDTINVDLQIVVVGPDENRITQQLSLECEAWDNLVTRITYETTVKDFANVKGMYYVSVAASSLDLTALADFQWDPPGGGGGPPQY